MAMALGCSACELTVSTRVFKLAVDAGVGGSTGGGWSERIMTVKGSDRLEIVSRLSGASKADMGQTDNTGTSGSAKLTTPAADSSALAVAWGSGSAGAGHGRFDEAKKVVMLGVAGSGGAGLFRGLASLPASFPFRFGLEGAGASCARARWRRWSCSSSGEQLGGGVAIGRGMGAGKRRSSSGAVGRASQYPCVASVDVWMLIS